MSPKGTPYGSSLPTTQKQECTDYRHRGDQSGDRKSAPFACLHGHLKQTPILRQPLGLSLFGAIIIPARSLAVLPVAGSTDGPKRVPGDFLLEPSAKNDNHALEQLRSKRTARKGDHTLTAKWAHVAMRYTPRRIDSRTALLSLDAGDNIPPNSSVRFVVSAWTMLWL